MNTSLSWIKAYVPELDVTALASVGVVGVIYILARVVGKVAGASLGAVIAKCESPIKKYLGLTLIPQAGVAIGLSLLAMKIVPQYGATIRAVVLCATLIYELIGPVVTKLALKKAGEIKEPAAAGKKVKNAQ